MKTVTILKAHFEPKPLLKGERFHFNNCNQKPNQLVAELKHYATNCVFGTHLDAVLSDNFVSGIQKESCRRKLSEHSLTLAKAFEIALNMENDAHQLREESDN